MFEGHQIFTTRKITEALAENTFCDAQLRTINNLFVSDPAGPSPPGALADAILVDPTSIILPTGVAGMSAASVGAAIKAANLAAVSGSAASPQGWSPLKLFQKLVQKLFRVNVSQLVLSFS